MQPPANRQSSAPKGQLPALTGLRIFAALHVVLYHFGAELFNSEPRWLSNMVHAGYIGVSLFYILSGFILTYVYFDLAGTRPVKARSFWIARIARIYPVFLLGVLIGVPLYLDNVTQGAVSRARAVAVGITVPTATQAWFPQTACELNCPSWSVSVEAFFYLLFPFLAVAFLPRIDTTKISRAVLIMVGLWLLSLVPPSIYVYVDRARGFPQGNTFWLDIVKFNPLIRLPEFLLGLVLGKLFLTSAAAGRLGERWGTALSFVSLGGLIVALAFSSYLPYPLLHNGLLAPLFALLIYTLAVGRGPLAWLLSLGPIVFLGEVSYALYIFHGPIWVWLYLWQLDFKLDIDVGHSVSYFLVYLLVMLLASIAAFKLLEIPGRDAIRRAFSTRAPQGAETRRRASLLQYGLTGFVALTVLALTTGFYAAGSASPSVAASTYDPGTTSVAADAGLLAAERFAQGIEGSGWQAISGRWSFENGSLVQRDASGYDHAISFSQTFSDYVLRVGLSHLQGSGGGVLFNMPQRDTKNGAHIARYTDEGTGIFWGYYDQNGDFVGQGFAPTLPAEKKGEHVLEVNVGADTYAVQLDGRTLAEGQPLQSKAGHIGLHSSVSVVDFRSVDVVGSEGGSVASAPARAEGDLLASLAGDGDLEAAGWSSLAGKWSFSDGALMQLEPELFDRIIVYRERFSDYTLNVSLRHVQGTGAGLLFNMPRQDSRAGAHMVRFSEDAKAVFWGFYDDKGDFAGEGSHDIAPPGTSTHTLEVRIGKTSYTVVVDDEIVAEDVPLRSTEGHIGLTTSQSAVAFEKVQVVRGTASSAGTAGPSPSATETR